ncbi:MAG: hypothetical protein U1E84_01735 [Rhodoferax sp.]
MAKQNLATVTNELIESYGNTAKNVISAYRVGNERAIELMDQGFATALEAAGSRLSARTRYNAMTTEKKITAYYAKSVGVTADNATLVVDKAVELAGKGVAQVSANANRFEKSTGVNTLSTLAVAAVPAAQAVSKVAVTIEAKSGELVEKIAGKPAKAKKAAAPKRAAVKKPVVKAAAKPVVKKAAKPTAKAAKAVATAAA